MKKYLMIAVALVISVALVSSCGGKKSGAAKWGDDFCKAAKAGDGWESEAEVYEESSFIKSLGLSTKVQDRNIYAVKLSSALDVESYERKGTLSAGE